MSGERIPCCVPYCRRTRKPGPFSEWICGKHWQAVSATTKRRRRLAVRILRRARQRLDAVAMRRRIAMVTTREMDRVQAARRLEEALWERCKREAIERAAGL